MDALAGLPEPVMMDTHDVQGAPLSQWVYRCANNYGISVLLGERPPHMQYASRRDCLYEVGIARFTGPGPDDWELSTLAGVTDGWPDRTVTGRRTLGQVQEIYRLVKAHG